MKMSIRRLSAILAFAIVFSLFAAFPAIGAGAEGVKPDLGGYEAPTDVSATASDDITDDGGSVKNVAADATYRGTDNTNGTTNYGEENWNVYHAGKLNDGVIPTAESSSTKGQNVEIYVAGFVSGTVYIYFDLGREETVTELVAYTNDRDGSTNRGYPSRFNVYVGNSEDLASAALFGSAVTTEEGVVRKYSAEGNATGSMVILELGISSPDVVITLAEVEIYASCLTALPVLDSPVLSSSAFKFTYDIPNVTWEAIEGAVAYDVYLDGALVAESITDLSFTPDVDTRTDYNADNTYKVTVVARSGSEELEDSLPSEALEFVYVDRPTDIDGTPLDSADFILDAGHGGTDPGALGDGGVRREADDNLAMAKAVGERLAALGFTVAYTRITDVYETPLTKAAKGEAGVFGYYMSFHRNSYTDDTVYGVETLYTPNDSGSNQAFARLVQDEIVALGIFANRNIKEKAEGTVLSNVTSMPVILMELGFVSNGSDNEKFDTYFKDIAVAIVKGAVVNAGYRTGYEGAAIVNEHDYTINDEPLDIHIDLTNYDPESSVLDLMIGVSNGLGIKDVAVSVNDGEWKTIDPENNIVIYGIQDYVAPPSIYAHTKDFLGMEPGHYTVKYKMIHVVDGGEIYGNETPFLTININVTGTTVVEPQYTLGDLNDDGFVDNLDATIVLKADAGLLELTEKQALAGDVNDDGLVDNLDATLILKLDAGLIENLG